MYGGEEDRIRVMGSLCVMGRHGRGKREVIRCVMEGGEGVLVKGDRYGCILEFEMELRGTE